MFVSRAHVLFALSFALLLPPHSTAALVDNKPRKGAPSAGDTNPINNHPLGEAETAPSESTTMKDAETIPLSFDSPFGSYPNLLQITQDERDSFSPVVIFPETIAKASNRSHNNIKNDILVKDHRRSSEELASAEDIERKRSQKRKKFRRLALFLRFLGRIRSKIPFEASRGEIQSGGWAIGKYDENRDGGMYESDLFDDLDNTIDGYGGRRTVHLGMDLGGPVGTPVHAFCDGIVHSVGYNPELGDYGHVIVVEHFWGNSDNTENHVKGSNPKRCWALYGHLDESTLTTTTPVSEEGGDDKRGVKSPWRKFLPSQWRKTKRSVKPGDFVHKGQVIGKMGDIDENGGWIHSHLHFQLSTKPPDQPHDMPGASSVQDRVEALQQYPDPRYVLGPLY